METERESEFSVTSPVWNCLSALILKTILSWFLIIKVTLILWHNKRMITQMTTKPFVSKNAPE